MHKKRRIARFPVVRHEDDRTIRKRDDLVVEEPLTILWQAQDHSPQRLSATMRTPGLDNELAAGLLFSEGLVRSRREIEVLSFCSGGGVNELNRLVARLRLTNVEAESRLAHRPSAALPQSACGLCAFDELASPKALLAWAEATRPEGVETLQPDRALLEKGLKLLATEAPLFSKTGASHACIVMGPDGHLWSAAEDVGRHNACDKAVGLLLLSGLKEKGPFRLPEQVGMLFSSRLSFELAVKAVRAGAAWIGSVGAPTHLAVELAQRCGLPLLGFCSKTRFNVYVGASSPAVPRPVQG